MQRTKLVKIGEHTHEIRAIAPLDALIAAPAVMGLFSPLLLSAFSTQEGVSAALGRLLEGDADQVATGSLVAACIEHVPLMDPLAIRRAAVSLLAGAKLHSAKGGQIQVSDDPTEAARELNQHVGSVTELIQLIGAAAALTYLPT